MKNIIIGIAIGLIIGVGATMLIYHPGSRGDRKQETPARLGDIPDRLKPGEEYNSRLPGTDDRGTGKPLPMETGDFAVEPGGEKEVAGINPAETPGEIAEAPIHDDDRIAELLSRWPEIYVSGNVSEIYDLLDELEEEGRRDIERMIYVFRESESLTHRLTAARTLGAINRDLADPDLSEIIKSEVFPFLKKTYREEASVDLRGSCLYAMGEVRTAKSRRFLEEMAENENRRISRAAIYSLGMDGSGEAIEKISTYWTDPEERRNSWTAAAGLADNGDAGTLDRVRDIYYGSGNEEERIMAAYTLGRMNGRLEDENCYNLLGSDALPFLNGILTGDGDDRIRKKAAWALGESGLREADRVIFRILESDHREDQDIKNTAVRVLGSSGGEEAAGDCLNLFRYGEDEIDRIRAVQVLGGMNLRDMENVPDILIRDEAIPFLLSAWDTDPSLSVKKEIISALGLTGGQEEIEFLERISSSSRNLSREIRRAKRRIEYRMESGEDWAARYRRRR